ncbi:hypothetical protein JOB18_005622 [Solea senegalensis]|uniref:Uncharacterized protein n=1 Tax=Solea senegalensis TaxID=28829 RepID=A0AAV6QMP8_SOLSE|nr:hypothetical protein JOB18_005622 [Solea senegalensis]
MATDLIKVATGNLQLPENKSSVSVAAETFPTSPLQSGRQDPLDNNDTQAFHMMDSLKVSVLMQSSHALEMAKIKCTTAARNKCGTFYKLHAAVPTELHESKPCGQRVGGGSRAVVVCPGWVLPVLGEGQEVISLKGATGRGEGRAESVGPLSMTYNLILAECGVVKSKKESRRHRDAETQRHRGAGLYQRLFHNSFRPIRSRGKLPGDLSVSWL